MTRHRGLTRRAFLRGVSAGAAIGALAARRAWSAEGAVKSSRPNILMILVDDLGYGDLSSYGGKDLRTPHVDSLMDRGMRFGRFYASCPVCSPTRAALLTGRYPAMVGVPGVIRTTDKDSWGYLSPDARTLPALLKPAGYDTAIVGKWHLGLASPNLPNERGFDLFHGFLGDMMDDYQTHRRGGVNFMRRNGETIDPQGHATDLFTQWACEYLRGRKGQARPFFLYLAYNAPHVPIQPPKDWLEKVQAREPHLPPRRAKLAAMIEHLDDGIGKVIAALKDAGLTDETLVVFSSDNGGDLPPGASNGATRNGKGTMYEGGLREPTCAVWPGRIQPGSRTDRVALTMDLMPTFLEAAGVTPPAEIEGRSILQTLLGKTQPPEDRYLFFTRREGGRYKGQTIEAVLHKDWKLLRNLPGAPLELYNLADDPLEKHDLAAGPDRPRQYDELAAQLAAYIERTEKVEWRRPSQRGARGGR